MRLPPLNALRAFEAAARHSGYIEAAKELHVTRGAISRQVKILEEHLGVQLFHRTSRGVELTKAGRDLQPVLTQAFRTIAEGTMRVVNRAELRVICPPALSIRWLMPRLPEFRASHPDIRLKLTTDFHGDYAFDGADYDIAISCQNRSGQRDAGICVQQLFPYVLTPVCAPAFLEKHKLERPTDLATVNLIDEAQATDDWDDWSDHFDVAGLNLDEGDVYPNFDLAIKAAMMGTGVIMGDLFLCNEELEQGTLVAPFPEMLCDSSWGWYSALYRSAVLDSPEGAAFVGWLTEIAEKDREAIFAGTSYA